MPTLPALIVGPLRIQYHYPDGLWADEDTSLGGAFYEESPSGDVVPLQIRFGSGDEELEGKTMEAGKREVGNDGDLVWIKQRGVVTRCDTAARTISMEVARGVKPDFLIRFMSSLLLPALDCVAVHSAAFVRDGMAYVCPGHSGAGKSTLSKIADEAGLEVLSDDAVVLGWQGGVPTCWGTVFTGDAYLASPGPAPLAGLYFLNHSRKDRLEPLAAPAAAARLLASTFPDTTALRPPLAQTLSQQMMAITFRMAEAVPGYNLHLRPTPAFLELLS